MLEEGKIKAGRESGRFFDVYSRFGQRTELEACWIGSDGKKWMEPFKKGCVVLGTFPL